VPSVRFIFCKFALPPWYCSVSSVYCIFQKAPTFSGFLRSFTSVHATVLLSPLTSHKHFFRYLIGVETE
jgi:hypothetical protein